MLWLRLIVVVLLTVGVLVRFRKRDNVSDWLSELLEEKEPLSGDSVNDVLCLRLTVVVLLRGGVLV
jgi:hypothetical protein